MNNRTLITVVLSVFILYQPSAPMHAEDTPSFTENENTTHTSTEESTNNTETIDEDTEADIKQRERDKKGVEYIKKTLRFGTHEERAEAISNIDRIKTQTHLNTVLTLMIDNLESETDPSVLRRSFETAIKHKRNEAADPISGYITHDNDDVQTAAVYALGSLEATDKIPMLVDLLKEQDFSTDSSLIEAILNTLADLGDAGIYDFAKEKVNDPQTTDFNRQRLILYFGRSTSKESAPLLRELFTNRDENSTIRSFAVNSLSKIGDVSVVPDINKEIDRIDSLPVRSRREYHSLYMYCIAALVALGDETAYPRLEQSLRSNNASVRLRAIEMMGDLKNKRSIDILQYKVKHDQNDKVRSAAKRVLKESFDIDLDEEEE